MNLNSKNKTTTAVSKVGKDIKEGRLAHRQTGTGGVGWEGEK